MNAIAFTDYPPLGRFAVRDMRQVSHALLCLSNVTNVT